MIAAAICWGRARARPERAAVLDAFIQVGSVARAAKRLRLSAAATTHALSRLREQTGDAILVRAGTRMVLTTRAEALRRRVRALVDGAEAVLAAEIVVGEREPRMRELAPPEADRPPGRRRNGGIGDDDGGGLTALRIS